MDVGTTVAVFEEAETGKAVFILLDTVDKNEVIDAMRYRIQQVSEKLVDKYSAVFVLNNFKDGEDFFDGVRVRYKQEFNANMNSVIELCRGMTKMYYDSIGFFETVRWKDLLPIIYRAVNKVGR